MTASSTKAKILVVDDNPENIWPLIEYLEDEFDILTAITGQQALDLVLSEDIPDLILLDIMMPGMDGYEVCSRLKAAKLSQDIPIIFLTGKNDEHEETKGLELGAQDYITKPFSLKVVRARIKAILDLNRELKRRLLLKSNMEQFNNQLEQQVEQKQQEFLEAKASLQAYDDKYLDLFHKQQAPLTHEHKRILVVDDNPDNIHILVDTLEAEYTVNYALNGQDALDLAFSADKPDLILLDVMMPDMDGYEVCARLKANADTWEIPIIFVTALDQDEDETKGLQLGAVDFVTKPFRLSVIEARIKSALLLRGVMDKRLQLTCRLEDLNKNLEKRIKVRTMELVQAHEDLQSSEKRYRAIFENALEGIFQSTPEGRFLTASPSLAKILGYQSGKELIAAITDIGSQLYLHKEDRKEFLRLLSQDSEVQNFEARFKRKNGDIIWVLIFAKEIHEPGEHGIYYQGFLADITEQKRADIEHQKTVQEKEELSSQLRQAQKMEAIGTLAGGIAHDFNNILTAIHGYSELIQLMLPADSEAKKNIALVLQASDRAKGLASQILTFSRQSEHETQPLQIHLVVGEALKLLRASIPTTIKIVKHLACDEGTVLADPTQIHQIMMNLGTNAFQAMQETGGILEVKLEKVDITQGNEKMVALGLSPGPYLLLTISDNGPGMDKATQERIFEPYFTTKKKGEGTGLGLAVVHGIIANYGGHIGVKSALSKGTSFQIYLPEVVVPESATAEENVDSISGGSERILVVDDEKTIVQIYEEMLVELGYQITATTDSEEALQLFSSHPENYDLLLTDQTMPKLTGADLAREFRQIKADIPIILCSGGSDLNNLKQDKSIGVKVYLAKPFSRAELAESIRKALE